MSRRKRRTEPPQVEQFFGSPEIDHLFAASTSVRDVFRYEARLFRVADALLTLVAGSAQIRTEPPQHDASDVARMWNGSTRRRSMAVVTSATPAPAPGYTGVDPVVAVADVAVDASQHPYDGDGWRMAITVRLGAHSALWVEACSHAAKPGFVVRGRGAIPDGVRDALRVGFSIRP